MSPVQARLAALAAAVLFSTGGAAIKTAAFTPAQVSCVRSGIAALTLLAWMQFRRRGAGIGRTPEWSPRVLGIGAVYGLVMTLFVLSTRLTTAANAIFLQSTAPLYLLLLGPWLLGERVRRTDLPYMGALAIGLILCFAGQPPASAIAPNPALGNLLGVVCSVGWALTLVALRWAQRDGGDVGMSAVVAGNLLACVFALPFAWPLPAAPAGEWLTLIYLGVLQIGVAYILLTSAMRELRALDVSLLLLIEPVLNPVWTWLVRGEEPGVWVVAGGAVIVAATAVRSLRDRVPVQAPV
jgi:drug/metabolite transporter (DMT)-like permease